MESLDRPYGDDEQDYTTIDPEAPGNEPEIAEDPLVVSDLIDGDPNAADPAFAAVEEAGGGVSEGFEDAESQLIENIENAPDADRTVDGFDLADPGTDVDEDAAADVEKALEDASPGDATALPHEQEALRSTAAYSEPDQVDVTEVVRDPAEGPDDPGAGPGIAFDR